VYVAVVFAARRIALIHVALPDTDGLAEKPNIAIGKPRKAKDLIAWRKIVVGIEKNPTSQKKWMIKLRTAPFLGYWYLRARKIRCFFHPIFQVAAIFAVDGVKSCRIFPGADTERGFINEFFNPGGSNETTVYQR
jgi:hypothetical protein